MTHSENLQAIGEELREALTAREGFRGVKVFAQFHGSLYKLPYFPHTDAHLHTRPYAGDMGLWGGLPGKTFPLHVLASLVLRSVSFR